MSAKWQGVQDAHDAYMTTVKEEEFEKEEEWIDELLGRLTV